MRGRIEPAALDDLEAGQAGIRIVGRVRWGFVSYVVWLMLALGVAIGTMAVAFGNGVIGWFILAPLGIAAVHVCLLVPMLRSDPPLLAEELRVVFHGEAEARELDRVRELSERILPGLDVLPPDPGSADHLRS